MKIFRTILLFVAPLLFVVNAKGQDTLFLKVHFLYGSKPKKEYRDTESKWFGGIMGGHVGVENGNGQILNFLPKGKFHWLKSREEYHSTFSMHDYDGFYQILGGKTEEVKKAIVYVPITSQQYQAFDSLAREYLRQTPYDYALFGMRCAAAAYDVLSQVGVFPVYPVRKTYKKVFYPKKLRKRLLKLAHRHNWKVYREPGDDKRIWEHD